MQGLTELCFPTSTGVRVNKWALPAARPACRWSFIHHVLWCYRGSRITCSTSAHTGTYHTDISNSRGGCRPDQNRLSNIPGMLYPIIPGTYIIRAVVSLHTWYADADQRQLRRVESLGKLCGAVWAFGREAQPSLVYICTQQEQQ